MKSLRPWRRRETASDALKTDSEDKKEDETKAIIALNALKQVATLHGEFLKGLVEIINSANAPLKISFTFEDHARLDNLTFTLSNGKSKGNTADDRLAKIGKLFNHFGSSFKMYSEIANNFEYMIQYFKGKHALSKVIQNYRLHLFVEMGVYEGGSEDIVFSEIEKPLHRLDEYMVILKGLLGTSAEMKRESKTLKDALHQFEGVSRHIQVTNEARRNKEELFRMERSIFLGDGTHLSVVAKRRKFIACGPLIKVCRREKKDFYFWLLSDQLIYGQYLGNNKFRFHR